MMRAGEKKVREDVSGGSLQGSLGMLHLFGHFTDKFFKIHQELGVCVGQTPPQGDNTVPERREGERERERRERERGRERERERGRERERERERGREGERERERREGGRSAKKE